MTPPYLASSVCSCIFGVAIISLECIIRLPYFDHSCWKLVLQLDREACNSAAALISSATLPPVTWYGFPGSLFSQFAWSLLVVNVECDQLSAFWKVPV